jgi:hypothetical protein
MRERNPFVFLNFVFVCCWGYMTMTVAMGPEGAYVYMWDMGARRVHNMKNVLICFNLFSFTALCCGFVFVCTARRGVYICAFGGLDLKFAYCWLETTLLVY